TSEAFTLAIFDLDGFKGYNDSFGHAAGDALLARMGSRLRATASGDAIAFRMGGDEFCLLAAGALGGTHPTIIAARDSLTEAGEGFSIGCSYGAVALHDVGKLAIPDSILNKPGPLDEEEWAFMRRHTLIGERIVGSAVSLREAAPIVRATHERWDGVGYPDGVGGEQIPLAARII